MRFRVGDIIKQVHRSTKHVTHYMITSIDSIGRYKLYCLEQETHLEHSYPLVDVQGSEFGYYFKKVKKYVID